MFSFPKQTDYSYGDIVEPTVFSYESVPEWPLAKQKEVFYDLRFNRPGYSIGIQREAPERSV